MVVILVKFVSTSGRLDKQFLALYLKRVPITLIAFLVYLVFFGNENVVHSVSSFAYILAESF